MAREDGLPPPSKKGRRGPEMAEDDPSIMGKLDQLAQQDQMGGGGGMGMGGGGEEQSAQLLMSGAQQMMQAAQMNPRLQPIIQQALQIIQAGVQELAGGGMGGGMEGEAPKPEKKRMRPPKRESGASQEEQFTY